jgi:predicted alpha/beta superfamily hydrolase
MLPAEPVTISTTQETQFGQSIFVSAPHPAFGGGDVTRAVKLSPHAYPVWSLPVELPAGLSLPLTYYRRTDSAAQIPVAQNGTVVGNATLTTQAATLLPQPITFYASTSTVTVEVRITAPSEPGFTTVAIPLQQTGTEGNQFLFTGSVPVIHRVRGRSMQLFVNNLPFFLSAGPNTAPITTPIRCHGAPLYYRHGQAFLYVPPATPPSNPDQVLAYNFTPTGFVQRRVTVIVPRNYNPSSPKRYPVIYAQDGQNVISPGGAFGSWDLDITIANMIASGELPEVILMAIDNTNDRFAEYTPEYGNVLGTQGRGGAFATALATELVPRVNADYRTRPEPRYNLHLGSSLGGLLGYLVAREHEDTWGAVIAMSPSFQVELATNVGFATNLETSDWGRLYIDSGTAGTSEDGYANTVTVRDALIAKGHRYGPDFFFAVGNGDQHQEAAWRRRTPEALRWWAAPLLAELEPAPPLDNWVVY